MLSMEDFLQTNGYIVRPIVGHSMLPLLVEGKDTVHLIPVTRELVPGDVPMYRRPKGSYVLHRIHKVKKTYYIIRGDNCAFYEKVPKSWVIAVMDGYSKDGKYIPIDDAEYRVYVEDILKSDGVYRTVLDGRVKEQGRFRMVLSMMFPSFSVMMERFPVLHTAPVLLPFLYVFRWISVPFSRNLRHAFVCMIKTVFGRQRKT